MSARGRRIALYKCDQQEPYVWNLWSLWTLPQRLPCPKSSSCLLSPAVRKKCTPDVKNKTVTVVYPPHYPIRNFYELQLQTTETIDLTANPRQTVLKLKPHQIRETIDLTANPRQTFVKLKPHAQSCNFRSHWQSIWELIQDWLS